MSDDWFEDDFEGTSTPADESPPKRPRRPWWEFNFIVLFLALFPLVYVRHLFNANSGTVLVLTFLIFSSWVFVGFLSRSERLPIEEKREQGKRLRHTYILPCLLVAGYFACAFTLFIATGQLVYENVLYTILSYEKAPTFIVTAIGFSIFCTQTQLSKHVRLRAVMGFLGLMIVSFLASFSGLAFYFYRPVFPFPLSNLVAVLLFFCISVLQITSLSLVVWAILSHAQENPDSSPPTDHDPDPSVSSE